MTILKMNTEMTRMAGRTLMNASGLAYDEAERCRSAVAGLEWESSSSGQFRDEAADVLAGLRHLADTGDTLATRVEREVQEWEAVDNHYAGGIVRGMLGLAGGAAGVMAGVEAINARQAYIDQWNSMTVGEKRKFLQKQHDAICDEFGVPHTRVKIKDLPDPDGKDAKGVLRPNFFMKRVVVLDVDNVNLDDPFAVQDTMAHETRHLIQHYYVEHPNAELPNGISSDQVTAWRENFNNYVRPENDFQGYRAQPVEADARDFGAQYVAGYFD